MDLASASSVLRLLAARRRLVRDRRAGVSAYYRANSEGEEAQRTLLDTLRHSIDDALLRGAPCAARVPSRARRSDDATAGPLPVADALSVFRSAITRPGAPGRRCRAPCCSCSTPATCLISLPATASLRNCSRHTHGRSWPGRDRAAYAGEGASARSSGRRRGIARTALARMPAVASRIARACADRAARARGRAASAAMRRCTRAYRRGNRRRR
ncbi:MAG: hypothetical protein WDW38_010078 [Sanguina aurantia]